MRKRKCLFCCDDAMRHVWPKWMLKLEVRPVTPWHRERRHLFWRVQAYVGSRPAKKVRGASFLHVFSGALTTIPEYSQATRTLSGVKVALRVGDSRQARWWFRLIAKRRHSALLSWLVGKCQTVERREGADTLPGHPEANKLKGMRKICTIAWIDLYNP
jgi:hypothetical protein